MAVSDKQRGLRVTTPFGTDRVVCAGLSGQESLSDLFEYQLTLLSEDGDLNPDEILGESVDIEIDLHDEEVRVINGFVTDFAQVGWGSRYHEYRAVLRPWLWFLSRTADCRIFQNRSVPEIFEEVVSQYRFTDFESRLSASYQSWEYCVQYRETDFNFLSRLLEQEGIYYFFEHQEGRHLLVLVDSQSAHSTVEGYDTVPYFPPSQAEAQRNRDYLDSWSIVRSIQTGLFATTDFDFENPRKSLLGKAVDSQSHSHSEYEIFDYPAELQNYDSQDSERVSDIRLEELQAAYAVANGNGNAGGLRPGYVFSLEDYPRDDFNGEYLIVRTQLSVTGEAFETGASSSADVAISVQAIDSKKQFRPPRVSPKPLMQGAQTAIVVGKKGEEIWTDEFGRVKVQFHWDRYGKSDEESSCWLRVAQAWAGEQWGAMTIPRIGQEVVVSFLEGDPDQPIVTGSVYNGMNKPPYRLPGEATKSGVKSRSTKGATDENFNEIRFEDKIGEEQVYIHAEKDFELVVENDQTVSVGNDQSASIDHDRSLAVANNESVSVGKNRDTTISENDSSQVGKQYTLEAGDSITLRSGSSELIMKKDGSITLKGVKILIEGAQSITEKAGQKVEVKGMQITVKGTKTLVEGTMLDLKASGIATLKGSLTKIG